MVVLEIFLEKNVPNVFPFEFLFTTVFKTNCFLPDQTSATYTASASTTYYLEAAGYRDYYTGTYTISATSNDSGGDTPGDDYSQDIDGLNDIQEAYDFWKEIYVNRPLALLKQAEEDPHTQTASIQNHLNGSAFRAIALLNRFINTGLSNGRQTAFKNWHWLETKEKG